MVPAGLADELLQALALAVVQVGDGLRVLVAQVGEQALDVVLGVVPLRFSRQRREERFQEGSQAWPHAAQQARRDNGIVKQLVQANAETSLHRLLLSASGRHRKDFIQQALTADQARDTVELVAGGQFGDFSPIPTAGGFG